MKDTMFVVLDEKGKFLWKFNRKGGLVHTTEKPFPMTATSATAVLLAARRNGINARIANFTR